MFGKKEKANYDRPSTVVGKDTLIESGKIESKASIQVNGTVKADLFIEASVVIGENGLIEGNVTAGFVLVAGKVIGDLDVTNQIHLTKTAVVIGNINSKSIVIDEGARIEGNFSMKEAIELNEVPEPQEG